MGTQIWALGHASHQRTGKDGGRGKRQEEEETNTYIEFSHRVRSKSFRHSLGNDPKSQRAQQFSYTDKTVFTFLEEGF